MKYFIDSDKDVRAYENGISEDDIKEIEKSKNITLKEISQSEVQVMLDLKIDLVAVRVKEIETRLSELDLLSLRPLRAIEAGSAVQYDRDKLIELDTESELLRNELRGLLP